MHRHSSRNSANAVGTAAAEPAPPAFDPPELPPVYTSTLSDAVKTYQHRHGITEDGRLTQETIKA